MVWKVVERITVRNRKLFLSLSLTKSFLTSPKLISLDHFPNRCQAIITGPTPGAGQCHGCPFRHQETNLVPLLQQSIPNITNADIKEIVKSAKDGHYHISCTRVFEIQHVKFGVNKGDGLGKGDSVIHPNIYYDKSRQLIRESQPKKEGGAAGGEAKKEGTTTPSSSRNSQVKKEEELMDVDG